MQQYHTWATILSSLLHNYLGSILILCSHLRLGFPTTHEGLLPKFVCLIRSPNVSPILMSYLTVCTLGCRVQPAIAAVLTDYATVNLYLHYMVTKNNNASQFDFISKTTFQVGVHPSILLLFCRVKNQLNAEIITAFA
jgi:hypothetical protein